VGGVLIRQFKDNVERDIRLLFHNPDVFADIMRVRYNMKDYKIPVIFDIIGGQERKKPSDKRPNTIYGDHVDSIFTAGLVVYISPYDLDSRPRAQMVIEIGDDTYTILKVDNDGGEIRLVLERLDE
jgi:hypothetical protein